MELGNAIQNNPSVDETVVCEDFNLTVVQLHEDGTSLYLVFTKQANEFIQVLVKQCELLL